MSTRTVDNPKVVSRDEWLAARKMLLGKEKRLTRERGTIAAERLQLPLVKVEKNYVFDTPSGKKTLAGKLYGLVNNGGTKCERQIRRESNLVHGMCTRSALCVSMGIGAEPADRK